MDGTSRCPYLDHPEELEYPTEAWAGQEFRKANVLWLAARHASEPLTAELLRRASEFSERAWQDLLRFETRTFSRSIAILMTEGARDSYSRSGMADHAEAPAQEYEIGQPMSFVPQRHHVIGQLKTVRGFLRTVMRVAGSSRWTHLLNGRGGRRGPSLASSVPRSKRSDYLDPCSHSD